MRGLTVIIHKNRLMVAEGLSFGYLMEVLQIQSVFSAFLECRRDKPSSTTQ